MANNQFFQMMYFLEKQKENREKGKMNPAQIMSNIMNRDKLGMGASNEHVKNFAVNTTEDNYNAVMNSLDQFKKDAILPEAQGYINSQMVNVDNIWNVKKKANESKKGILEALKTVDAADRSSVLNLQSMIVDASIDGALNSQETTYWLKEVNDRTKEYEEDQNLLNIAETLRALKSDKTPTAPELLGKVADMAGKEYTDLSALNFVTGLGKFMVDEYGEYGKSNDLQTLQDQKNVYNNLESKLAQIENYWTQFTDLEQDRFSMLASAKGRAEGVASYGGESKTGIFSFDITGLYDDTIENMVDFIMFKTRPNQKEFLEFHEAVRPSRTGRKGKMNKEVLFDRDHPDHKIVVDLYKEKLWEAYKGHYKKEDKHSIHAEVAKLYMEVIDEIQARGHNFKAWDHLDWNIGEPSKKDKIQLKKINVKDLHDLKYFQTAKQIQAGS